MIHEKHLDVNYKDTISEFGATLLGQAQHRLEMLELLLKYGTDPNSEYKGFRNRDTIPFQVGLPLGFAVDNLDCTKLLLKYVADLYRNTTQRCFMDSCYKYPVWYSVFMFE